MNVLNRIIFVLLSMIGIQTIQAEIITYPSGVTPGSWLCFRKEILVEKNASHNLFKIAADSKYWLYAVYTLNGGAQQESTSVRVKAEITGLAELLEQSVGTKLEAARDVEPGSSAWLLAGISVGCTIGAAVVTILVLRVHSRLKKRRKTARHHKKA